MMPIMSVNGKKLSPGKRFHLNLKPEGNSDTGEGTLGLELCFDTLVCGTHRIIVVRTLADFH